MVLMRSVSWSREGGCIGVDEINQQEERMGCRDPQAAGFLHRASPPCQLSFHPCLNLQHNLKGTKLLTKNLLHFEDSCVSPSLRCEQEGRCWAGDDTSVASCCPVKSVPPSIQDLLCFLLGEEMKDEV
jgi:hypothetical protein